MRQNITKCNHKGEYQPSEPEINIHESYTCIHCGADLDMPNPDWDLTYKEKK